MGVYIVNFGLLLGIGLAAERHMQNKFVKKMYCIYACLQMTLIAALRWGNGIDYNYYYNNFYKLAGAVQWSQALQESGETGYLLFTWLVSRFTGNIIVYLFLFYGIMYALLMRYIYKYCENPWIAVAAFLAFDYFALSFCFMRQCMAMVIGLYVIEAVKKRKMAGALMLTVIASLFHTTALCLIIYMVVSYIDFSSQNMRLTAFTCAVFFYVGFDFMLEHMLVGPFEKYRSYLGTQFMQGNHILVVFYPLFVYALVLVFEKQLLKQDESWKYLMPVLFAGCVFSVMTTKHYVIERVGLYAAIYGIRMVSAIAVSFKKGFSGLYYRLAVLTTVVICIGAFMFGMRNDRYGILPYRINENYLYNVEFIKSS